MRIFQNIFLTKEEKEYLKLYQERYHKLSLKERKYVLKCYKKYESEHIGWTQEQKEKEANEIIFEYFGVSTEEELNNLIKQENDFVSFYEAKYNITLTEEEKTSLILDYQKYKQLSFNEACEKILIKRRKNDNKNFNP